MDPSTVEKGKYGFFVKVPDGDIRILQLTDVQIIDSSQMRTPGRLCVREYAKWVPERVPDNALRYVEEAVRRADPHLIILTGDNVYGEFDDSGRQLRALAGYLGSFGIPWAPVFGNHDNESAIDPERQCEIYENAPNCLFMRGNAAGYGNYAVTLTNSSIARSLLMIDTHGCLAAPGIRDDQVGSMREACREISGKLGKLPPLFACYHIPSTEFLIAAGEAGYQDENDFFASYEIGVTVPAANGDFGIRNEAQGRTGETESFMIFFREAGGDGIFAGHYHKNSTSILSRGIRYTFGLKTGVYDYHDKDRIGSTLITVTGPKRGEFKVEHQYSEIIDDFWEKEGL